MNALQSFAIIMMIWTISDAVSKKTKSLVSSLLVASIFFLVGFKTNILPADILVTSALLPLGATVVGLIIIHLGTMLSIAEFKKQWKTVVIGVSAILSATAALLLVFPLFGFSFSEAIAAVGGITGGTISVILVQDAAIPLGLTTAAVLPILIVAIQGIIGFPITSFILRKEALRIKAEGPSTPVDTSNQEEKKRGFKLPEALQTTAGTLFTLAVFMLIASQIAALTGGAINEFVVALLLGVALRHFGVLKPNVLSGIDAFGFMMITIMIIIFGPLANLSIHDLIAMAYPLLMAFVIGISGGILGGILAGKVVGFSTMISTAISLTMLFGFPGTMILSQEAAKSAGDTPEEISMIEGEILPKMIVAGFSTVTVTSVLIVGFLVQFIG
ncbi:hypothetical protein AOC36_09015 [Erysipelothrix larvae]|uniref:Na+/glutamate symporter n=1 Tax=Erysipelothrix larvae TaxID=1514105 RepID=A0A109UHI9_9FIRM|nr:hypothetical protein [Erysipelothrix larvae]AMC94123.1 hypothetical protein AOC36_09015 [Erysipelothrix larvae]